MNQILSVEQPKPKHQTMQRNPNGNNPIEIEKIVRFFAIVMIIFGVIIISSSSYAMYKGIKTANTQAKPTIYVEETSDTQLKLQITHSKPIQKATYNWNNQDSVELATNGKKKIEQTIEIPTGENTLNVYAVDKDGKEINYSKVYTRQGDININFEVDGSQLKITANGKDELSYLTYRWDDEQEEKVDINSSQIEQSIDIPKGQHKLTVVVVDVNNKTQSKEQEVKGVTKPKLEVTTDGSANFVINASDDEGIKRVEFIINETDKRALDLDKVLPLDQRKEFKYSYPLHDGENRLEVTVYNESGVSETSKVLVNK